MANSAYEYVKNFELADTQLPSIWLVVRVDGVAFTALTSHYEFLKPNDIRALNLMNDAARSVMNYFKDIVIAIGMSDEYSFVLHPDTQLFGRRTRSVSHKY
jgi:tRNA(His) guanylyltransferase